MSCTHYATAGRVARGTERQPARRLEAPQRLFGRLAASRRLPARRARALIAGSSRFVVSPISRPMFNGARVTVSNRQRPLVSMQDCCGLTRRQLIQLASASAAAGLVTPLVRTAPAVASSGRTGGNGLYAQDLELVTVTDTSFVLTWYTAGTPTPAVPHIPDAAPDPIATDGVVRYGTDP